MTTTSLRFDSTGTSNAPVPQPAKRVVRVVALVALVGLFLVSAFTVAPFSMRLFFGFSALAFAASGLYLAIGMRAQRPGSLRFAGPGPLTFRPTLAAQLLLVLAPLLLGIAGIANVLAWSEPNGRGLRFVGTVLYLGVGVLGTLSAVLHTRRPAGLEISPSGLRWRRTFTTAALDWDELAEAEEPGQGSNRLLRLHTRTGTVLKVYPLAFAADPVVVTALISFYLENESQRELLNSPERAIAVFAERAKLRRL
ncbi:hypothetical protein [Leucobacter iarius]|uniref:PH (Pleckstrin Homology) domain-containing protein n=1 Tax=Leucobacter iarius TaxID=333963 RepID=A0ABP4Y3M8_9MICO